MIDSLFHRLAEFLVNLEPVVALLWAGLAVLTVILLILMRTRWGQSRPLRKCVVLSILAHLLFVGYATTVQVVSGSPLVEEPVLHVAFIESSEKEAVGADDPVSDEKPWEQLVHDEVPQPDPVEPDRQQSEPPPEPQREVQSLLVELPGDPSLDHLMVNTAERPEPAPGPVEGAVGRTSPADALQKIDVPPAQRRDAQPLAIPAQQVQERQAVVALPQPIPQRAAVAGVPTALLEQPVPLPQLATPATTADPATSLAGMTDELLQPARSRPAEPIAQELEAHPALTGSPKPGKDDSNPTRSPRDRSTLVALDRRQGGEMEVETMSREATVVTPPASRRRETTQSMPQIYRLRVAPDRSRLAERRGATPETEEAVKAALKWLAGNQRRDGRWDASEYGAGRELVVAGRNRYQAGIEADTGITALALLTMLASGHTHREGAYRENVRRGLEYLLRSQARDGNLGGRATPYAKMYCHSMAAFALSEAYGMTGDYRLRKPVRSAVNYTLAAQSKSDGGWRYKPGDPGDTSQAGWQLMALKSAELAGLRIPVETRNGLIRYLRSASGGEHGGLASYRPGEGVSRPMTAEALVCWQFLGMPRRHPASNEAGDYLLGELPSTEEPNLYYWYYATLGMYQLGGVHWQQWNDALRKTLVETQRKSGSLAGSWDPNTVWGGYGGRVYSTSLAALCLEVYYRFLPMYVEAAPDKDRAE